MNFIKKNIYLKLLRESSSLREAMLLLRKEKSHK